jgi:hypothetical protein
MENLGLRDDPEQEGWEKMGPLADPTPANAKNRGAAYRKRRRRDENGRDNEAVNERQTTEVPRAQEEGIIEGGTEDIEMDGIREAVAEAIYEEERDNGQQANREQEEEGRQGTTAERPTEMRDEGRGQGEHPQQQQSGQHQQRQDHKHNIT